MPQAKSTTLTYGDSGAGKTTLIASLAQHVDRTEHKRTRVITGDGGRVDSIAYLIDLGILELWDISNTAFPFETINQAAMGYWPKDASDPKSPLDPPTPETWKRVGAVAFEGLTGFGQTFLSNLMGRAAKNENIGGAGQYRFMDGNTWVGGTNLAHYGVAQRRIIDAVDKSRSLPGVHVNWTALQMRATDDDTKLPIFGPEVIGRALTSGMSRSFANSLNLVEHPLDKGKKERRLYISTWFDSTNPTVPHVCKNRIPAIVAGDVPDYLVVPSPPPVDKPWGLGEFLDLLERKQAEAKARYGTQAKATVGAAK